MTRLRHFVSYDPDGSVSHLVRIRDTPDGQWGEYYRDGAWHEDSSVIEYLFDGSLGQSVSEEEASAIIAELGE